MLLALAAATSHLGVFVIVIAIGFVIGVYGQVARSRTLILTGIVIIGLTSAYFLALGENAANCHGTCL